MTTFCATTTSPAPSPSTPLFDGYAAAYFCYMLRDRLQRRVFLEAIDVYLMCWNKGLFKGAMLPNRRTTKAIRAAVRRIANAGWDAAPAVLTAHHMSDNARRNEFVGSVRAAWSVWRALPQYLRVDYRAEMRHALATTFMLMPDFVHNEILTDFKDHPNVRWTTKKATSEESTHIKAQFPAANKLIHRIARTPPPPLKPVNPQTPPVSFSPLYYPQLAVAQKDVSSEYPEYPESSDPSEFSGTQGVKGTRGMEPEKEDGKNRENAHKPSALGPTQGKQGALSAAQQEEDAWIAKHWHDMPVSIRRKLGKV